MGNATGPGALLPRLAGGTALAVSVVFHGLGIAAAAAVYRFQPTAETTLDGLAVASLTITVESAPVVVLPPSLPPACPTAAPAPGIALPRPSHRTGQAHPMPAASGQASSAPSEPAGSQVEQGSSGGPSGSAGAAPGSPPVEKPKPPSPTAEEVGTWMGEYGKVLYVRVAGAVVYPEQAEREKRQGVVVVRLSVDSQGRLTQAALVGQADAVLAAGAMAAVRRASPFPPPPARLVEAVGRSLSFDLPLRFYLRE